MAAPRKARGVPMSCRTARPAELISPATLLSKLQKCADRFRGQVVAPVEETEFDQELGFQEDTAHHFDEPDGCRRRAARGQQIIDENYAFPLMNRVRMHLDDGFAVFQGVSGALALVGELALFAHRH